MSNQYPMVYLQKHCPVCHSENLKPVKSERNEFKNDVDKDVYIFDKTWVQLLKCNDCTFAFSKEIPSQSDFFSKRYDIRFDPQSEVDNKFKEEINNEVLDTVQKVFKKNGKFLDIGSFAGNLIGLAKGRGFECYGVEANATMATFTKEKLGFNVYCGEFVNIDFGALKFDVITLIDVLEHLFEPKRIMQKCATVLEKDGLVYIKVPHYLPQKLKQDFANFFGISKIGIFSTFGHINQFSPKSLYKLAEECSLKPIANYVARSEMMPGNSLKSRIKNIFRNGIYHLSELFRKVTGINIGLNIIVVYQKQ